MDASTSLLEKLIAYRFLIPSGEEGVFGRTGAFESIISGLESAVARTAASDSAEVLRFPPAMARAAFERSGYMKGFPQLAGTVHAFCGGEHEHAVLLDRIEKGEDWSETQRATGIVLVPAACYPLYPAVAAEGPVKSGGRTFDLQSYCFRHEPSPDPARMQIFRMREFVRVGTAEQAQDFRAVWIERAKSIVSSLELPFDVVPANDPFFGRAGRLIKNNQREQGLKLELVIPVAGPQPTACASFNYHQDHFATTWGLEMTDGEPVHTACVGFGLERLALALLRHHGFAPESWPSGVRQALWG